AEAPRRQHKIAFTRAQDYTARQARRASPTHQPDHRYHQQKCGYRADLERQKGAHGNQQVKPGHGDEDFGKAQGHVIHAATVHSRKRAEEQPSRYGKSGGHEPGKQRNLPTIEQSGELVATEAIAAQEEESGRSVDAEEVPPEMKGPQESIAVSDG